MRISDWSSDVCSSDLDVPQTDVIEMNRRLSASDSSLNVTIGADGDTEWMELLGDDRPSQETLLADADELSLRRQLLNKALEGLTDRERKIVLERRLREEPMTLEALSHQFNVSRERVRRSEEHTSELQSLMRTSY